MIKKPIRNCSPHDKWLAICALIDAVDDINLVIAPLRKTREKEIAREKAAEERKRKALANAEAKEQQLIADKKLVEEAEAKARAEARVKAEAEARAKAEANRIEAAKKRLGVLT